MSITDETRNMEEQEDDYDEEADSDFASNGSEDEGNSSDTDVDGESQSKQKSRSRKHKDTESIPPETQIELDSGDEATIQEQQKARRRSEKKVNKAENGSEDEIGGWRARTRAMRAQDKEERKRNKLASSKSSTIDVDAIWNQMNIPGPLPPVRMEDGNGNFIESVPSTSEKETSEHNKENLPISHQEEMITIKRKFQFAGEVHLEEKLVPKASAEAQLWLAQQESKLQMEEDGKPKVQRPLRKISRFDPNYHNLSAFEKNWARTSVAEKFAGPKLNVVEKSKMDWAAHVDSEGLKDELDLHAKAKEGYHNRMDFLNQVEQRKEDDARLARMKR